MPNYTTTQAQRAISDAEIQQMQAQKQAAADQMAARMAQQGPPREQPTMDGKPGKPGNMGGMMGNKPGA